MLTARRDELRAEADATDVTVRAVEAQVAEVRSSLQAACRSRSALEARCAAAQAALEEAQLDMSAAEEARRAARTACEWRRCSLRGGPLFLRRTHGSGHSSPRSPPPPTYTQHMTPSSPTTR